MILLEEIGRVIEKASVIIPVAIIAILIHWVLDIKTKHYKGFGRKVRHVARRFSSAWKDSKKQSGRTK